MIPLLILFFLALIIILLFTSKTLSPIPYFPTNKKDLNKIIDNFELKNDQVIFDLGAGDGAVVFSAADKAHEQGLNVKFLAVEVNIILVLIMLIKKWLHPHGKHIKIYWKDMFKIKYRDIVLSFFPNTTPELLFYIYISPWFTEAVGQMIKDVGLDAKIVSYYYPVKGMKKYEVKKLKGENTIFIYQIK